MNAIEARNERRLGFDRDEQKGIRHAAGTLRQVENRGNLRGTTQQAMINASRGNRMAPMITGAGAPAPAPASAPAPGGAAPAAPAGGAAPAPAARQQPGSQVAQNILAQRTGKELQEADQRAGKPIDVGLGSAGGLAANVLTGGLYGAGKGLYGLGRRARAKRQQGKLSDKLSGMAQGNPTAYDLTTSYDDPYGDFWDLQKTMHTFRIKDSTEALRYAYQ